MIYFLLIILSYTIGSIPFGYLVGKYIKGIDIRQHGSGNIGASNAFRVLGAKLALLVLLGDCIKGFICIYLSRMIGVELFNYYLLIGMSVILGHNWSIFLKFKGGKGIATTYGVVLAIYPFIAICAAIIWGIIVWISKIPSLGSLISIFFMIIMSLVLKKPFSFILFGLSIFLLAMIRHRKNIARLINKEENRINF